MIKDCDERTFKVDSKGNVTLLPQFSEVVTDQAGNAVIKAQPYHDKDGNIIFPGTICKDYGIK